MACTLATWDDVMPCMLEKSELSARDGERVRTYVVVVLRAGGGV